MKYLIPTMFIVTYCVLLPGCSKKDTIAPFTPTDSTGRINKWISDSLRRYYYWSDQIPGKPDYTKSPNAFFQSLLSSSDRFSWISNGIDIIPPSNSYFTYGFHYAFLRAAGYDDLIGVVTAINKGGAADNRGIKRGDYFLKVNGAKITEDNMEVMKEALRTPGYIAITLGVYGNGQWGTSEELALPSSFAAEDPVQYTRVFTAGGIATGYLCFNSFNEYYDESLLAAVGKLKAAGITELVLDLRYNAGGSVASSAKLACLLAGKLNGAETYVIYGGNRYEGKKPRTLQAVLNTSGNNAGRSYADLKRVQLVLNRVFILATEGTVSAAELVINNLKPFLQVVQIGGTTRGKNEAGFVIADSRNPRQVAWQMEPTVYKLFNKNGEGDYEQGLVPQYPVSELSQLPISEMGVAGEPLLHRALQLIYGSQLPDGFITLGVRHKSINATRVYSSTEDVGDYGPMIVKPQ